METEQKVPLQRLSLPLTFVYLTQMEKKFKNIYIGKL